MLDKLIGMAVKGYTKLMLGIISLTFLTIAIGSTIALSMMDIESK